MNIESKSIGTLFSELFAVDLKLQHEPDNEEIQLYRHTLGNTITARMLRYHEDTGWVKRIDTAAWEVAYALKEVLQELWDAEGTMSESEILIAHEKRDSYIKKLDDLLNEG
jgi:hypothetical protein